MAQSQYNFKIEDELKEQAEILSKEFENKEEFLKTLLNTYTRVQANNINTNIDMSKYDDIEENTKKILSDAFKHIIYSIQANNTNNKQLALSVEKDKIAISDERIYHESIIKKLQAEYNQSLLDLKEQHHEELKREAHKLIIAQNDLSEIRDESMKISLQLSSKDKEIEQLKAIAEHTQELRKENKEFREYIDILKKQHHEELKREAEKLIVAQNDLSELRDESMKISLQLSSKDKEIEITNKVQEELKKEIARLKLFENENIKLSTKLEMVTAKD